MIQFSFSAPPPFRPYSLVPGGHAQTILPYFFRPRENYRARQYRVPLEDGDVIVLHDDCPADWAAGDRIAVLVHGLGGSHSSGYLIRLAATIYQRGYRVLRMDMRGCGAGLLMSRGVFHADRSEDLLATIRFIAAKFSTSPITVCGFSLGGNLTLKMLGKAADGLPSQLDSALVVEPPIDLGYCCHKLSHGAGWIYDRYFSKRLWRDFCQRRAIVAGADRIRLQRAPANLLSFDRKITAPLAGFDTADAYYRSASAADVLSKILIHTVILTAADDPIIPKEIYNDVPLSRTTQFFVVDGGGHLGFYAVANQDAPNRRWMDHRLADWIDEIDAHREAQAANRTTCISSRA